MKHMARLELPYVKAFKDRHGKPRLYFRRKGYTSVSLPGKIGSVEFMTAYADAAGQRDEMGAGQRKTKPKTIRALRVAYYTTAAFKTGLSLRTQHAYRLMIDKAMSKHDDKSALAIQPKHINAILEELADTPAQASNLRKRLMSMFAVAVSLGWRNDNPVREADRVTYNVKGFTPWSEEDIDQFRAYWLEVGEQKPIDALTVLLSTGVRRSDAHTLGRQHLRNGMVSVLQDKGGVRLTIPAHPELIALAGRLPTGQMGFILTEYGEPYSEGGFTNWFVAKAKKAGLPNRTPHGLRKAVGRRLAEAGCSEKQIAAVLGHDDPNTAKVYTKSADQIRLATDAMDKIGSKPEHRVSTQVRHSG